MESPGPFLFIQSCPTLIIFWIIPWPLTQSRGFLTFYVFIFTFFIDLHVKPSEIKLFKSLLHNSLHTILSPWSKCFCPPRSLWEENHPTFDCVLVRLTDPSPHVFGKSSRGIKWRIELNLYSQHPSFYYKRSVYKCWIEWRSTYHGAALYAITFPTHSYPTPIQTLLITLSHSCVWMLLPSATLTVMRCL